MRTALYGLPPLLIAWGIHMIQWRVRMPRRHLAALLATFAAVFVAASPLVWLAAGDLGEARIPVVLHAALFYWAAAFVYLITYTALEGDSPTLSLMRHVAASPAGLDEDALQKFVGSRPFVTARLEALRTDGLVEERAGKFFSKGSPPLLYRGVLVWRQLLGMAERGG